MRMTIPHLPLCLRYRFRFAALLVPTLLVGCGGLFQTDPGERIVIQKGSDHPLRSGEWDDVVDVYGFADDYSVAEEIAEFLSEDGGNYRVVPR